MHATGYLESRSRHPVALVAAVTLNLAAVGVMLAYNPQIVGITPPKETEFKKFPIPLKPEKPVERQKVRQPHPSDPQPRSDPQPPPPDTSKTIVTTGPTPWPDFPPPPPIPTGDPIAKPDPIPVLINASVDPRYAEALQPVYPPNLERQEIEGRATVRVQVGTDGRVMAVELIQADDPGFFAATRDQALRRWRFRPATRDGQPVVSWVTKTVVFKVPRT
jgi:protein TonB